MEEEKMFKLSDPIRVFQVLFPQKGIEENAAKLRSIGVSTFDVRDADVRNNENNAFVETIYILRCSATDSTLKSIRGAFPNEMMYEGYKTFY